MFKSGKEVSLNNLTPEKEADTEKFKVSYAQIMDGDGFTPQEKLFLCHNLVLELIEIHGIISLP